nr:methionine S-methyltransferase [Ipomoea batatas]
MAVKGLCGSVDEFLTQCELSGDAAYAALRSLLERLEDPNTRKEARIFLTLLQKRLNRHPDSIFEDKTVAELGCGNGWISIAIAEKWSPLKVYGLDINPRAIKISWINLYFNALDDNGEPIYYTAKKTLLDRVEFHESDLLSYCRDNHIELERIVGCIPQILNPNPDAMSKMITENASEEFLHSLSNYCALQGFVEDQFGLGLIARAVEEGISVIKPMGIMIFNMGGRPGQGVCKRLFERRGLRVTKLWQTKVLQAADTDISALVEIEKNSPHRFEFFMGLVGDQPICARTAWAYGKSSGRISHALSVYSCQLRQPNQVKKIFEFVKNGFHDISNSLDLSFEDDAVADEKIPFLAYLASVLKENAFFPYELPAGSKRFRNLIAGFMKTYHHIPLTADNVVVFPSRAVAIENVLRLFLPCLAIVDEQLSRHLPREWLTSLNLEKKETAGSSDNIITVIEAPRQSDSMVELIKKLKPQLVVTGVTHFESVTSSAFELLLETTREIGCRLFLDISDQFELSSLPNPNGVLKYLAGTPLPPHAAIVCGLLKNKVYSDLEVAFVISEEEKMYKALSKLADRHPPLERQAEKAKACDMIGFPSSVVSVLDHAEFAVTEADSSNLIHMDVDQSFLPIATPVKAAIFESFVRQNVTESEIDMRSNIRHFLKTSYGFPTDGTTEFVYADSTLALFNKLVLCCIQEGGTLCFPTGSNGNYVSAAKFLKANVVHVPTNSEQGFKLTEKVLGAVLEKVNKPWIYISGPTVSPTGQLYSNDEIKAILSLCAKFGARVVIDTSSSGVEFNSKGWGGWDLEDTLTKLKTTNSSFCVSLLGGLFLKMLTGGLGFGFLLLNQPDLVDFHCFSGLNKPHSTIKYTVKKLMDLREQKTGGLLDVVAGREKILSGKYEHLKETLEKCGWDVLGACSGVSVVAKPTAYLGKTIKINKDSKSWEAKIDDSNIREAMLRSTGLCINSSSWTGLPGYCRFVFGLEDSEFERALACIVRFKELVGN